ncbi:MAG: hypothetical protein JRF64_08885 [Deltaproteobacteria bacterium]|nr:hypothetical protein [Deltaproteobacteria bacterium]
MKKNYLLALLVISATQCLPIGSVCFAQDRQQDATYVGAAECKKCHEEIYKGWKSTMHPYKFQRVSPEAVVGDFRKNNRLKSDDKAITMLEKDGEYFITTTGPDEKEHTYKIKYLIGEFWKQLYVTEFPNGELHILPAMWIVKTQSWQKSKYWSDTIYQYSCSGCHNTGTQINYDKSTNSFKTTWSDLGVACESCHGPGSKHLDAKKGEKASTIINPTKIPDPTRAAMVCGSCHIRGTSPDGKYGYPYGYKPGDQLNFMFNEKPKLHPDDSSRANRQQYIDWKKSGHAREGIMCWDCHYSHKKGNANKFQTKLPGSSLCRSCHEVENKGVHGIHSVNNCVGCHMPPVGKRATKGDVHSHQFKVISPKKTIAAGGSEKQPNSCNACHYHINDKPEEMLNVLERVKTSGKNRRTFD